MRELPVGASGLDFRTGTGVTKSPVGRPSYRACGPAHTEPMKRHLPHIQSPGQASDEDAGSAGSVLFLGTTASNPEPWVNSGLTPFGTLVRVVATRGVATVVEELQLAAVPTERPAALDEAEAPITPVDPDAGPAWARDEAWLGDMEYVFSARVRAHVETLTERARRYRAAARALEGGRPVFVPGLRRPEFTRQTLRRQLRELPSHETCRACAGSGRVPGRVRAAVVCRRCRGLGDVRTNHGIVVARGHGAMTVAGRRVELLRSAEWCENRARAASMSRLHVARACRGRWRRVACGCGTRDVPVGCDQTQLCDWCRKRHWRKWRKRITRAMAPHLRAAVDKWHKRGRRGPRPGIYLITLTATHSGDLGTDRRVMERGWRALSKRASYGGYQLGKGDASRWSERKWWGHHALVWEATDGTAVNGSKGHLHAHVAAISQWVPYPELRATWNRAIADASDEPLQELHVEVVSPKDMQERAKALGRKSNDVQTAAFYLSKYVTKGVEPTELSGKKAGELLAASRGRRKVTTSRGFWRAAQPARECPTCKQMHVLVGAPIGLQQHAPHALIASAAERSRWRVPRGAPQSTMTLTVTP